MPFRKRRTSHAVRARDVPRLDGRPALAGSAHARQEFKPAEDQRSARLVFLPRVSAGSGRHMDAIAMSGNGFQAVGAAEIGVEERGRG